MSMSIRPMNYALTNQSQVSSTYEKNIKGAGAVNDFSAIMGTSPVQYPNAQVSSVDNTAQVAKSIEAGKAYNSVASSFAGQTSGYDQSSAGLSYSTVGSNFDMFA